jgi:hypothetical protein
MTPEQLEPFIREQVALGDLAAAEAWRRYAPRIGNLLLEAYSQVTDAEFWPWVKRQTGLTKRQARQYMNAAGKASTTKT